MSSECLHVSAPRSIPSSFSYFHKTIAIRPKIPHLNSTLSLHHRHLSPGLTFVRETCKCSDARGRRGCNFSQHLAFRGTKKK